MMKKYRKPLAMVLAMILCIVVFTACTGTTTTTGDDDDEYDDTGTTTATDDTADDATDDPSEDADANAEVQADVIGKVTAVYDSTLELDTYTAEGEITDYTALDVAALTATSETEYPFIYSDCEYYRVSDGSLTEAAKEDVSVDQMVAVITNEDGVQQVIILNDPAALEEADTTESYPVVAEVHAIAEDGTWTLYIYALSSDAAGYEITDYAAVELDHYTYAFDTLEYAPAETTMIQFASEGSLTDGSAADVAVGDMVVIYTDAEGNEVIAVYPADTDIAS